MVEIAAITACILLLLLTVFQVALIAGVPLGEYAWGGQHKVLPTSLRIGSIVSIFLYIIFSILILDATSIIDVIPAGRQLTVAIWVLVIYSFFGIVLNTVSKSKKERHVMVPVATVLFICSLVIALNM